MGDSGTAAGEDLAGPREARGGVAQDADRGGTRSLC